jgi:hypothetical protein
MPPTETDTDTDDPVVVPHFEERLLERLHDRQRSGAWGASAVDPALRRQRLPGLPRPRLVAAAAAVALLAGGAAVTVALTAGGDGPDLDTAATVPDGLPPGIEPILAALDAAIDDGSIAHITSLDGRNEAWVDLRSGAERTITPDNTHRSTIDWGRTEAPPMTTGRQDIATPVGRRWVDHCLHQYADTEQTELRMADAVTPMRDALAAGQFQLTGPATVDGRELLRLDPTIDLPEPTGDPDRDTAELAAAYARMQIVYVDPTTQLPVRIEPAVSGVGTEADGTHTTVPAEPGSGQTVELLPRTADDLALLVPPIPAGYTRVDHPALDEVRLAGCVG